MTGTLHLIGKLIYLNKVREKLGILPLMDQLLTHYVVTSLLQKYAKHKLPIGNQPEPEGKSDRAISSPRLAKQMYCQKFKYQSLDGCYLREADFCQTRCQFQNCDDCNADPRKFALGLINKQGASASFNFLVIQKLQAPRTLQKPIARQIKTRFYR